MVSGATEGETVEAALSASVRDSFATMQEKLRNEPARLDGIDAVYGFRLLGDGGGDWELAIAHRQATVREGAPQTPDMTCVLEVTDFLDLVGRRVAGRDLFFSGRMGVLGNATLGMLLGRLME